MALPRRPEPQIERKSRPMNMVWLLKLAAFAAALNLCGASPILAEDGGHARGGDDHGPAGLPGLPIGGGGATPGGAIGGGLSGGVGGPGGLGGGPRLGGGGGGGGSVSPLSPNSSLGTGFHRADDSREATYGPGAGSREGSALGPGAGWGGDRRGPDRAPIRTFDDPGPGPGLTLRREVEDLPDHASDTARAIRAEAREMENKGREVREKAADEIREAKGKSEESAVSEVSDLTQARKAQVRELLQFHRDVVEPDNLGRPVVRGEILALSPSSAAIAKAERAGFRIRSDETLPGLGVRNVVLLGPRGISAVEALNRLRALDPAGRYDFNHIYQESGAVKARAAAPARASGPAAPTARGVRVGLVDGGVAAAQPALSGSKLVQRGFAPGGLKPSAHGTAVASLIAGRSGRFRGAAPGATLYVADVYGSTAA
ncbi:hypothetical protein ACFODM_13550, partial [Phenylobacterium soli]